MLDLLPVAVGAELPALFNVQIRAFVVGGRSEWDLICLLAMRVVVRQSVLFRSGCASVG